LKSGVKNCFVWPEIEPTVLELGSQPGAFDHSAMATPLSETPVGILHNSHSAPALSMIKWAFRSWEGSNHAYNIP